MTSKKNATNFWFTIEPYVHISITDQHALLYNTFDGVILESDKVEVIELLRETLQEENCGVVLLTNEKFEQKSIKDFIAKLREKYMGDIIDIALSKGKPVQILPFCNLIDKGKIYKSNNYSLITNVLENLSEISIHVNNDTNITELISFLQSLPEKLTFNIIGNIWDIRNYEELLIFFNQHPSPKYIYCSYINISPIQPSFQNNFSYKISIHLPIDMQQWNISIQVLLHQTLPVEYIFDVSSDDDCLQVEQLIDQFKIEKYQLNPVYTGENIRFFEENVFLTKKDILSTSMTIKDFFSRQLMNLYDFGKINIMPNGDAYANINHPVLGNIYTHSIYEIVNKEVEEGKSWLRVRDQAPCNDCVYQWLCPSPSNYEIAIGRPNLCHVNNGILKKYI